MSTRWPFFAVNLKWSTALASARPLTTVPSGTPVAESTVWLVAGEVISGSTPTRNARGLETPKRLKTRAS